MQKYKFNKTSKLERPRNIPKETFYSASFGEEFIFEPKDVPLRIYYHDGSENTTEYNFLRSLKNTINYYSANDDLFDYELYKNSVCTFYAFSSAHAGPGIIKGTLELNIYQAGSLIAKATDFRQDGVLYESGSDDKVGIVLYNEGIFILNNTSSLSANTFEYHYGTSEFIGNPKWIYYFLSSSNELYYDIGYEVKNDIATNYIFVTANKNELNHSNNETYLESGSYSVKYGDYYFKESEEVKPKKLNKSPFVSGSAAFDKETYITKIGIYDEDKKLIGITSLANPIRKTEGRDFIFKLRLDI